eukprot:5879636-Pleurochrysis_carterae.AAC.1
MSKAFQKWRRRVGHVHEAKTEGKEEGEGEIERERERMELNIGVESDRFRKYIFRSRTFYERALDDHYLLFTRKKNQLWVPQDP